MRLHPPSGTPRVHRIRRLPLALGLACGVAALATLPGTAARASAVPLRTSGYTHVIEVVMENLGYSSATTSRATATLAHKYASASDSYAASPPSLPSCLDLTSGSTCGVSSDCLTCYRIGEQPRCRSCPQRVTAATSPCAPRDRASSALRRARYAAKHNPFRYYDDIRSSKSLCRHLLPLTSFTKELRRVRSMPGFSFVTPNLCHDGHDCSPSVASSWLQGFVKSVTASSAWKQHGLLIVTWDEGADSDTSIVLPSGQVRGGGGGHIATLLIAPGVRAGTVVPAPLTHESILASIESNFHLAMLQGAAAWSAHTLVIP